MIIRDPVHGDMSFNESERRVMDTRQMQRLRGVRQTGSAYLVYPGCVHTSDLNTRWGQRRCRGACSMS